MKTSPRILFVIVVAALTVLCSQVVAWVTEPGRMGTSGDLSLLVGEFFRRERLEEQDRRLNYRLAAKRNVVAEWFQGERTLAEVAKEFALLHAGDEEFPMRRLAGMSPEEDRLLPLRHAVLWVEQCSTDRADAEQVLKRLHAEYREILGENADSASQKAS